MLLEELSIRLNSGIQGGTEINCTNTYKMHNAIASFSVKCYNNKSFANSFTAIGSIFSILICRLKQNDAILIVILTGAHLQSSLQMSYALSKFTLTQCPCYNALPT